MLRISNIKIWSVKYAQQQEQIERKLAQYLYSLVEQAAQIHQPGNFFQKTMHQVWQGQSRGRKFYLPPGMFPNDISNIVISFGINEQTMNGSFGELLRYQGKPTELVIAVGTLNNATGQNQQNALRQIEQSIYHETDHIYSEGSDYNSEADDKIGETIRYLSNPGEMQAHAWQFAIFYTRNFPSQPFNLANMQQIAEGKAHSYFIAMADPAKQQQYAQYGNVAQVHQQMVQMTQQYVEYLRQQQNATQQPMQPRS